jgi:hypothetical protein
LYDVCTHDESYLVEVDQALEHPGTSLRFYASLLRYGMSERSETIARATDITQKYTII